MNILIIEDDAYLASCIQKVFQKNIITNRIVVQTSYIWFLEEIHHLRTYDIIITDIVLSDNVKNTGIDILTFVRKKWYTTPVVIISSIWDVDSLENAFKLWANDYIIKPFRLRELEIRVNKWFHNYIFSIYSSVRKTIQYHDMVYQFDKNEFYFQDKKIYLSRWSKYLLFLFIIHNETLLSEIFLIEKIWGDYRISESQRNIRICIMRLKEKLQLFGIDGWIENIRWEWYILQKTS